MTESTIVKEKYVVTAKNDCVVTAIKNDKEYTLLTLKAGEQGVFIAISNQVAVTDQEAIIIPFA